MTRDGARCSSWIILLISLLFSTSCGKTWPKNLDELGSWPLPPSEAKALRALVAASKLPPKQFLLWSQTIRPDGGQGARIHEGHVREVYLANASLRSLAAVEGLGQLRTLNVEDNALTSLRGVKGLRRLVDLRVGGNPIRQGERLDALVALRHLDLTGTRLESLEALGKIPPKVTIFLTGKLPKLRVEAGAGPAGLSLGKAIPSDDLRGLGSLQKLIYLHIYKEKLPLAPLCQARNLHTLKISHGHVTSLKGLAGCTRLKALDLTFNNQQQLATLPPLPALETLEIFGGRMTNLALPHLPALKKLTIHSVGSTGSSALSSLAGLSGAKLPRLRTLRILRGSFTSLDVQGRFPELRELSILESQVRTLRGLIAFPRLVSLTVRNCALERLGGEIAARHLPSKAEAPPKKLARRRTPRARGSGATATSRPASRPSATFPYLRTIDASRNAIRSLAGLARVSPTLRKLLVARNKLVSLRGLEGAKSLRFLEIQRNKIKSLLPLAKIPLVTLHGWKNQITSAAPVVVKSKRIPSLTVLDLRDNPLTDLPESERYYRSGWSGGIRSSSRYGGGGGYSSGK